MAAHAEGADHHDRANAVENGLLRNGRIRCLGWFGLVLVSDNLLGFRRSPARPRHFHQSGARILMQPVKETAPACVYGSRVFAVTLEKFGNKIGVSAVQEGVLGQGHDRMGAVVVWKLGNFLTRNQGCL